MEYIYTPDAQELQNPLGYPATNIQSERIEKTLQQASSRPEMSRHSSSVPMGASHLGSQMTSAYHHPTSGAQALWTHETQKDTSIRQHEPTQSSNMVSHYGHSIHQGHNEGPYSALKKSYTHEDPRSQSQYGQPLYHAASRGGSAS